jgi:hypothetical protein
LLGFSLPYGREVVSSEVWFVIHGMPVEHGLFSGNLRLDVAIAWDEMELQHARHDHNICYIEHVAPESMALMVFKIFKLIDKAENGPVRILLGAQVSQQIAHTKTISQWIPRSIFLVR